MKITPEQAREALDAWICRPGMTQEQATILITEAFWGARRIRKKSYAKVFRASVRAETSRLPVCGSAARRNRRLG
ncbi:hypothetical protein DFX53_17125 [Escherichia coli]|nr:hypothetical protein [Escherichia coli]